MLTLSFTDLDPSARRKIIKTCTRNAPVVKWLRTAPGSVKQRIGSVIKITA